MRQRSGTRSFTDRHGAGVDLARALREHYWHDPLVLGLARGGVIVADAVARDLGAPLEVSVARKIGAPGHPEFGVGATTAAHEPSYDHATLEHLGLTPADLAGAAVEHRAEARRMLDVYQGAREQEPRADRDVIVVDDGLATGVTATAALRSERASGARTITLAVPVGAAAAAEALRSEADLVLCLAEPEPFRSVGQWYREFAQVTDEEVVAALEAGHRRAYGAG